MGQVLAVCKPWRASAPLDPSVEHVIAVPCADNSILPPGHDWRDDAWFVDGVNQAHKRCGEDASTIMRVCPFVEVHHKNTALREWQMLASASCEELLEGFAAHRICLDYSAMFLNKDPLPFSV